MSVLLQAFYATCVASFLHAGPREKLSYHFRLEANECHISEGEIRESKGPEELSMGTYNLANIQNCP